MEIEQIKKSPLAKGKRELLAFMDGKRLSYKGMVLAKCYECTNGYIDGKEDCNVLSCPIHPVMPYRSDKRANSQTAVVAPPKFDDPASS